MYAFLYMAQSSERDVAGKLSRKNAELLVEQRLRLCGMQDMFTLKQLKAWAQNEQKYEPMFPLKVVYYLAPEDCRETDASALFEAIVALSNEIPRKALGNKSPREANASRSSLESRTFSTDTLDRDQYIRPLEKANACMQRGDFETAYGQFVDVITRLLRDKVPFFSAFRFYANAAICQRYLENIGNCKALIDGSLRLNPRYDFGQDLLKRYTNEIQDFSHVKKADRKIAELCLMAIERLGADQYRRSIFGKYEKFLADCGISLAYRTTTLPDVYVNGKQYAEVTQKQPCPCGSGRKFKHCHGNKT